MPRSHVPAASSKLLIVLSMALIVAGLYLGREVFRPFALGLLLTFLLAPLVTRLERLGLHRVLAVTLVVVCTGLVAAGIGWVMVREFGQLADRLPEYRENIAGKVGSLRATLGSRFSRASSAITELGEQVSGERSGPRAQPEDVRQTPSIPWLPPLDEGPPRREAVVDEDGAMAVRVVSLPSSPLETVATLLGPLAAPLSFIGIVTVFLVFMLLKREDLRNRFIRLVGETQLNLATRAMEDAGQRISRYLRMQTLINFGYGAATAAGLAVIGIPNAALWGALAGVMRFLPFLGPWIGASMPVLLSLVVSDSWIPPACVITMFIVYELLANNVFEPWLYGSSTGISVLGIIVAAVFWTWLWGFVGLLMAMPLTVCIAVLGKYVPQLRFLNILLSDEPALSPVAQLYQRLLALDEEEAAELIDERMKTQSPIDVYDTLLIPALSLAERDRHDGEIEDVHGKFVVQAVQEIVDECGERTPAVEASPDRSLVRVLCLPARDEADEAAALMLAQTLRADGYRVEVAADEVFSSEKVEAAAAAEVDLVVISALPPLAVQHARYLYKRLRQRALEKPVVVGLWNASGKLEKVRQRIGDGSRVEIVRSLAAARDYVRNATTMIVLRKQQELAAAAAAADSALAGEPRGDAGPAAGGIVGDSPARPLTPETTLLDSNAPAEALPVAPPLSG